MIILSFCLCLLVFVAIGVLSVLKNHHTNVDYLIAGHSVRPWLVALSAVATNNSGYMFVGMIGYTYMVGLSSVWLMVGWIVGDFIASLFIHKKLRIITQEQGVLSFAGVLSQWHGNNYKLLRLIGGIITIVFLGTYAAAQLNAGSKALHTLFGWDYAAGAMIGAVMVVLYCVAGGIRASIWTDAAQSFVMFAAMAILCVVSINTVGGISEISDALDEVSPSYMQLFPEATIVFPWLFIIGWVVAGFGVIGQPHIMVRFMAMDQPKHMNKIRIYYYSWYIGFYCLTIMAGLAAKLLLPETTNFDAELALPALAQLLLPEILVGLVLAGLFAATMSTADSQILSCTAAVTRDFTFGKKYSYLVTKLSTLLITLAALLIALYGSNSVFDLVLIAWSALACSFGPLLVLLTAGVRPSQTLSIITVITGLAAMLLWRYFELNFLVYEVAPGMLAGFVPFMTYYGITTIRRKVHRVL